MLLDALVVIPTAISPVHNITFSGITFEYTTWNTPTTTGYFDNQSGVLWDPSTDTPVKTPAAVQVHRGDDIDFTGDVIQHTGDTGIDLADGTQKWKWAGDGATYASPVLMTVDGIKLIVAQTDKRMIALGAADGKLLWEVPFAPTGMAYNAITPIADGQTLIYSGQKRGIKAVKFAKKGDGVAATELWSNPQLGSQFSTPVLENGLIFGLSDGGNFFCIDAKTGKTAWTDAVKRGGYGGILDAGSIILALTSKSELAVFQATDKAYTQVAQIKLSETPTYASPIASGKRVFVKDEDKLTMWSVE